MGRGRQKAKQQKVARELKYNNQFTDLDALQRELGSAESGHYGSPAVVDDADEDEYEGWTGTDR